MSSIDGLVDVASVERHKGNLPAFHPFLYATRKSFIGSIPEKTNATLFLAIT